MKENIRLSIIVPSLNAAAGLGRCLHAVNLAGRFEVIVADGGSRDGTIDLAKRLGGRVLSCEAGRGAQLAAGAAQSRGEWLLFLHADTVLIPGWGAEATRFIANPENAKRAAAFRFALDDESKSARWLEAMVNWRCRALGLAYGDQGLLIARRFYDELGGFRPLPLMEDVDLIRRIGCKRLTLFDTAAVTSAARYRKQGYVFRPLRNLLCLMLYYVGAPMPLILRLYG